MTRAGTPATISAQAAPSSTGISIVKKTNGADANDPNGADVPNIKPGDPVTWTYIVTNTGSTHVAKADVKVTDNTTGVTPTFSSEQSGNGDQIFDPGEVWIYTATGTALDLTQSPPAGTNTQPNPDLKQNKNYEAALRLDRQLVANVGVGVAYVYHRHANWYDTTGVVNVGRPYDVWTVPLVLTDPYNGQPVTIYTFPPAYAGAALNANKVLNAASDRPDYYHSFELTANKRFSKKWNMSSSFWITKTHQWIRAVPTSPNDDLFPVNDTWAWEARADANYRLPADFNRFLMTAQSAILIAQIVEQQRFTPAVLQLTVDRQ